MIGVNRDTSIAMFRGRRVTQIYTSVTVIPFIDGLILQMDVWSKDSFLFGTKKAEIPIRGNCEVRSNFVSKVCCIAGRPVLEVKGFLYFFRNYSASIMNFGNLPSNSNCNASDAVTPCFRHVDRYPLIRQKVLAPVSERKQPDIFC